MLTFSQSGELGIFGTIRHHFARMITYHIEIIALPYMVEIKHQGMYMIRKYWCLISTKKTQIEK